MDRADRIIKINESLQKVQLNEAIPLLGVALRAIMGGISKVGGGVIRGGNAVLDKVSGGNEFLKHSMIANSIQGAQAGAREPTTPGAPPDGTGGPHSGDESEGTPGQNRPNRII